MTEPTVPKTIGACADRLYKLREERYALNKKVDAIKEEEHRITEHVINTLPKSEATGIAGKTARVAVKTKEVPQVTDWVAFYAYVAKNKAFDLLQKRVSDKAVTERWENKKQVPGVVPHTLVTLSLTKV